MKVYIGPYIDPIRIRLHDRHMIRKYGLSYYLDEQDRWDEFIEKIDSTIQWFLDKTINYFRTEVERDINIRIDPYDIWSMDHTLALVIHPMLLRIKKAKGGSPQVDDGDVPEHLKSTTAEKQPEQDYDVDSNYHARWEYVLDEMIFAFENIIDDSKEYQLYKPYDKDRLAAHTKRIQNGLNLFGKYYRDLWT